MIVYGVVIIVVDYGEVGKKPGFFLFEIDDFVDEGFGCDALVGNGFGDVVDLAADMCQTLGDFCALPGGFGDLDVEFILVLSLAGGDVFRCKNEVAEGFDDGFFEGAFGDFFRFAVFFVLLSGAGVVLIVVLGGLLEFNHVAIEGGSALGAEYQTAKEKV